MPSRSSRSTAIVPAGERIVLRLESPVHTKQNKEGDLCTFATAHNIFLGLGETRVLPPGIQVQAVLYRIRRGQRPFRRPEVLIEFERILLPDGRSLPFPATILRAVSGVLADGPDLLLRKGMLIEVALDKDLRIPQASHLLIPWTPDGLNRVSSGSRSVGDHGDEERERSQLLSPSRESRPAAAGSQPRPPDQSFTMRVDVDLVIVEPAVRDRRGQLLLNLQQEDFRVFEDGVRQTIREFSRGSLPLAVALLIDRSDSISPYLEELQATALEVLRSLGPEDQVSLFTFSETVDRLQGLTLDRGQIPERITGITPKGRTNIYDAVTSAAYYLQTAAPNFRHAIILISDNRATSLRQAGEGTTLRMALQTETVVYSLKLPSAPPPPRPRILTLPVWVGDYQLVDRIVFETGGELVELSEVGPLPKAMENIITRLKRRYTLGYVSSNESRERSFRRLKIQLAPRFGTPGRDYYVHARRGYYPLP